MITVEVAFALPREQKIISLQVEDDCTAHDAVVKSGIVALFPEIDPDRTPMGVFGKVIRNPQEYVMRDGDRVEIYRPLIADPKEARAKRAAKMKAQKAVGKDQA
jgi:putative ubiquitin-RnfH superfamily antitoxin RatB of RatAB toxin-antitoxin module